MAWTSHGHHIPGTTLDENIPNDPAVCGGVARCHICSSESALYKTTHPEQFRPPGSAVEDYQQKAKTLVIKYFNQRVEKTDNTALLLSQVYVVWFSKTLQNWKALLSTTVPDGMYYEVTYNGDMRETYIDAYKKFDNVTVPDGSYS